MTPVISYWKRSCSRFPDFNYNGWHCFSPKPIWPDINRFKPAKKLFWITLSGAIINVILNLILIPKYSLYGAAATTVATVILTFFLYFRFTSKFTPIRPLI